MGGKTELNSRSGLTEGSLSKCVRGRHRIKIGISNYLSGKVDDVKELVQVASEDNRLYHYFRRLPNPAELLKSGDKLAVIEELKNYDYIFQLPEGFDPCKHSSDYEDTQLCRLEID